MLSSKCRCSKRASPQGNKTCCYVSWSVDALRELCPGGISPAVSMLPESSVQSVGGGLKDIIWHNKIKKSVGFESFSKVLSLREKIYILILKRNWKKDAIPELSSFVCSVMCPPFVPIPVSLTTKPWAHSRFLCQCFKPKPEGQLARWHISVNTKLYLLYYPLSTWLMKVILEIFLMSKSGMAQQVALLWTFLFKK